MNHQDSGGTSPPVVTLHNISHFNKATSLRVARQRARSKTCTQILSNHTAATQLHLSDSRGEISFPYVWYPLCSTSPCGSAAAASPKMKNWPPGTRTHLHHHHRRAVTYPALPWSTSSARRTGRPSARSQSRHCRCPRASSGTRQTRSHLGTSNCP